MNAGVQDIPLRDAWTHEARDFTPWLAENLDRLSELLGLELELICTERPVGSFNLDIDARDLHSDDVVANPNNWVLAIQQRSRASRARVLKKQQLY